MTESEPNDTVAQAQCFTATSGTLAGALSAPHDVDMFSFETSAAGILEVATSFSDDFFRLEVFRLHQDEDDAFLIPLAALTERLPGSGVYRVLAWLPAGGTVYLRFSRADATLANSPLAEEAITYCAAFVISTTPSSAVSLAFDSPLSANEGAAVSTEVEATPASNTVLRWINAPEGSTVSDGLFQWTPGYNSSGTRSILVVATNYDPPTSLVGETAWAWIEINVADVNRPPVVTGPDSFIVEAGGTVHADFQWSDPDGGHLAVEVLLDNESELPSGLKFDPVNRTLHWPVGVADIGTRELKIAVTDSLGAFAVQDVAITVLADNEQNDAPQPPDYPGTILDGAVGLAMRVQAGIPGFEARFWDRDPGAHARSWQVQLAAYDGFGPEDIVWDSTAGDEDQPLRTTPGGGLTMNYTGAAPLARGVVYFWRSRVRDNAGAWSGWSDISTFELPALPAAVERAAPSLFASAPTIEAPHQDEVELPQGGGAAAYRIELESNEGLQINAELHEGDGFVVEIWKLNVAPAGSILVERRIVRGGSEYLARDLAFGLVAHDAGTYGVMFAGWSAAGAIPETLVLAAFTIKAPGSVAKGAQGPREKDLSDLKESDSTHPENDPSVHNPTAKLYVNPDKPRYPPAETNPITGHCKWLVEIKFRRQENVSVIKKKRIVSEGFWGWYDYKLWDQWRYNALGIGAYSHSATNLVAAPITNHGKVVGFRDTLWYAKDGAGDPLGGGDKDEKAPDSIKSVVVAAAGLWQIHGEFQGTCGKPKVYMMGNSTCRGAGGVDGGSLPPNGLKGFELLGAASRSIVCDELSFKIDSKIAWGVKWEREEGKIKLPSVSLDALDSIVGVAQWIIDAIQDQKDGPGWSRPQNWSTDPDQDWPTHRDGYGEEEKHKEVAKFTAIIKSKAVSYVELARPDYGDTSSMHYHSKAFAVGWTDQMIFYIGMYCLQDNDNCSPEFVQLRYNVGKQQAPKYHDTESVSKVHAGADNPAADAGGSLDSFGKADAFIENADGKITEITSSTTNPASGHATGSSTVSGEAAPAP